VSLLTTGDELQTKIYIDFCCFISEKIAICSNRAKFGSASDFVFNPGVWITVSASKKTIRCYFVTLACSYSLIIMLMNTLSDSNSIE
jgi:hypothetical protein